MAKRIRRRLLQSRARGRSSAIQRAGASFAARGTGGSRCAGGAWHWRQPCSAWPRRRWRRTRAPEAARTAEQFIETAREVYSVENRNRRRVPEATAAEIVVCREWYRRRGSAPAVAHRARHAAGEKPPDPIPDAPYVLGLPECGVEVTCHEVGKAPPPVYIVDFDKIPVALTPEEARMWSAPRTCPRIRLAQERHHQRRLREARRADEQLKRRRPRRFQAVRG
jgi:hypothetical protein